MNRSLLLAIFAATALWACGSDTERPSRPAEPAKVGMEDCVDGVCTVKGIPGEGTSQSRESRSMTSAGGDLGTVAQALSTSEITAIANGTDDIVENYSSVFRFATGPWEMVSIADDFSTPNFAYGCTRDAYATWCQHTLGVAAGGDDSAVFHPDDGRFYAAELAGGQIRIYRTTDPCPASCGSATWQWCNYPLSGSVDYPYIVRKPSDGKLFVTYSDQSSGVWQPKILELPSAWCTTATIWSDPCSSVAGTIINPINADFSSDGKMHLAFNNATAGQMWHDTFDPGTHTFACTNEVIGPSIYPDGVCSTGCTNIPTLQGLESDCLRDFPTPTIAIDRASTPNSIVVAYASHGGTSCPTKQETRWYRSTNGGATWSFTTVTGCKTSVHPRVAAAWNPFSNVPGLFQTQSTYVTPGSNKFHQVSWRSADGGQTWAGTNISSERSTPGPISGSCYWGDFDGIASDRTNGSFFYSWTARGSSNYNVHGRALNE